MAGDVMPGTGGARKSRWAAKRQRPEWRRTGDNVLQWSRPAGFLMAVFREGEKANLCRAKCNALRGVLADLVAEYRRGAK